MPVVKNAASLPAYDALIVTDIGRDGTVHAPDRPGLGYTLRPDALERFKYVDGPEYRF